MTDYKQIILNLIEAETTPNRKATVAGKIGVHENYIDMVLRGDCGPGPKVKRILDRMDGE